MTWSAFRVLAFAGMDHTRLGATGLEVSRLCLGTMTFGREIGEADSHRLLDRFVAAGGTFIDTADGYSEGRSEEIAGSWLKGRDRQDLVVGTKVRFGSGPDRRGLSRKHLLDAVDASLRRLGTDYVDLYELHMWDYGTPLDETLRALDTIVRSCWVCCLGVSNVSGAQLQRGVDLCRAAGWEPLVSLQPLYNLLDRDAEWELIPVCVAEGLGVLPYSPLRGGWLTGKIRRGAEPPAAPRIAATDSRIAATDSRVAATDQSGEAIDRPGEPTWTEAWGQLCERRPDLERGRRTGRRRGRDRPDSGADGAELAAAPARRHGADHRRPHDGAARRQPRSGRLHPGPGTARSPEPGERQAQAVPNGRCHT